MARPSIRSSPMRWDRGSQVIPVDADGLIDEAALDAVLAEGPALVAIQQVNNETGVIQPLDRLAARIRDGGVAAARRLRAERGQAAAARRRFHRRLRRTSWAGRRASARCWSRTSRRWSRSAARRRAIGAARRMRRRRRPSRPRSRPRPYDMDRLAAASRRGSRMASRQPAAWSSPRRARGSPPSAPIALPGASSASLLVQFDLAGIAVSAGSACSSGKMKESACARRRWASPPEVADGFLRISFGPRTSEADVDAFLAEWRRIARARGQGRMIYLDYQATTPVAPEVAAAMRPWIEEKFANPHSPSRWGREAAAAIEVAREQVEQAHRAAGRHARLHRQRDRGAQLGAQGDGRDGSRRPQRIVTVATEHAAVLDTCEWLEGQGVEVDRPAGRRGRPGRSRSACRDASTSACCWSR